MKTCYKCGSEVRKTKSIKEGIKLDCIRCKSCGEEYFTSSELIRFDIATGRKSMVRKFGTLGDSTIMRLPPKVIKAYKIKPGDYAVFEERPDGILIRPMHAKEMKF